MDARSAASKTIFWAGSAVGWAIIGFGVRGVLHDSAATRPSDLGRWFIGLLLAHDLVLVPLVLGAGWLVGRVFPPPVVVAVRLGLAASAVVVAVAFPLVRGYGERDANPSLLPLPYGRNLAIALALVWLTIGVIVVARTVQTRR